MSDVTIITPEAGRGQPTPNEFDVTVVWDRNHLHRFHTGGSEATNRPRRRGEGRRLRDASGIACPPERPAMGEAETAEALLPRPAERRSHGRRRQGFCVEAGSAAAKGRAGATYHGRLLVNCSPEPSPVYALRGRRSVVNCRGRESGSSRCCFSTTLHQSACRRRNAGISR